MQISGPGQSNDIDVKSATAMTSSHHEHKDVVPIDLEDPHAAALQDNPEHVEKLTTNTLLALFFVILGFASPSTGAFALIAAILVPVGTELGDVSNVIWIINAWSIAASISFTIAGKASDIFGRRWIYLSGVAFSVIGSIIGATANSTLMLAAASAVVGWGAGIIFVGLAGISELLPNKYRSIGLGLTDTIIVVPWIPASVYLATLLNTKTAAGWRWCYYISIIYGGLSLIGTFFFYYPPARPQHDYEKSRWQQFKDLDYPGLILYSAGLTIMLIGLSWGGSVAHPWKSASTLVPLILGFFLLCACFIYDYLWAKDPLFPPQLLNEVRDFTLLLVIVFVAGMVYFAMSGLGPQVSQYIFSNQPMEVARLSLPSGFGLGFFGGILSLFIGKIGHLKIQMIVYVVIQTVFIALYSVALPGNETAWMGLQFFGYGPFATITINCYVIAGLNSPLKFLGLASGLIGTFRCFGGAVGNAIFGSILNSLVTEQLPLQVGQAALAAGLPESSLSLVIPAAVANAQGIPNAFGQIEGISPAAEAAIVQAAKEAYAYAFKRVFWASIPFGIVALVCALCLRDPSQYLTNHTAVHMETGAHGYHDDVAEPMGEDQQGKIEKV